ncbi:MAG: PIG-L deacetylase family protein [Candidatus Helarchaeota archaeon]
MKVIFFAAHPDDLDFNCSGTIRRHLHFKDEVHQVYMTSGDLGWLNYGWGRKALGIKREREAIQAGKVLGVKKENIHFLRFPDGALKYNKKTVTAAYEIMESISPDRVYSPENRMYLSAYKHDDHIAAGMCVEEAVKHLAKKPVLLVYHSYIPNFFIDVSNFYTRESLKMHETQQIMLKPGKILHLLMAVYFGCKTKTRRAEAYRKVNY